QGRITGWSPGWYAGFPMLAFYFPLPFLLIAALSAIIKFQIAFKLITVLGIFLLPITTYTAFRVLGFKFPLPVIAAGMALPFLFMESYTIYGGNILSTLAGEFGYSISFSLSILFIALLHRDIGDRRFRVSTGVLLGLIALSHIVTTIVVVLFSTCFLIGRRIKHRLTILLGVFGLGFALSAFWGLPFIDKLVYTAHMQWDQLKGLDELFPNPVRPFLAFSALGLMGAISRRDFRTYPYYWALVISMALFFFMPGGRLWNGRLLPFFYFFTFVWAAYGIWFARKAMAQLLFRLAGLPKRYAEYAIVFVAITLISANVVGHEKVVHSWISWNYSGFEGKAHWKSFNEINKYITQLPEGRVMIEHSTDIDLFGTPRAFELLPYFADHPTIEGTLMEASVSAPFHFVNQAELSKDPSYAILGIKYPGLDVAAGVKHLELFNIRYFLALSDTVKREADLNPDFVFLKSFDVPKSDLKFRLYEVKGVDSGTYISIPKYEPLIVDTKDWRNTALKWYSKPELFNIPLLDAKHAAGLDGDFKKIDAGLRKPAVRRETVQGKISNVRLTDNEISFTTTAIGVPHLVKVSYFPNWQAEGAKGPYLASPAIMMVIPTEEHVALRYGYTASDKIGGALSITAWLGVLVYGLAFAVRFFIKQRNRRKETGEGEKDVVL
ncbi:MAG: hypothetical protein HY779_06495, partial [Rubrobacteridae bacterium]|nr:hypothetical protein [Rubrobacteridae bacterium]